jgi:hypothetical protein
MMVESGGSLYEERDERKRNRNLEETETTDIAEEKQYKHTK